MKTSKELQKCCMIHCPVEGTISPFFEKLKGASSLDCEAMEGIGLLRMSQMEPLVAGHLNHWRSVLSSNSPVLPSKMDRFQSSLSEHTYKAAALNATAFNLLS